MKYKKNKNKTDYNKNFKIFIRQNLTAAGLNISCLDIVHTILFYFTAGKLCLVVKVG